MAKVEQVRSALDTQCLADARERADRKQRRRRLSHRTRLRHAGRHTHFSAARVALNPGQSFAPFGRSAPELPRERYLGCFLSRSCARHGACGML